MTTTIRIPELGEGVDKVDVVAVLIKVGDTITIDQPLIEVETDKAAVEVPATSAGKVTEIHVEAGASLGPDAPIVTVEAESATVPESEPASESETVTETATVTADGGSDGEQPQQPATATAPAPPTVPEIHHSEFIIQNSPTRLVPAAPTVRRFAREVGMEIAEVKGSGPGGRISIDDVKLAVSRRLSQGRGGVGVPTAELPDFSRWGEVTREPMSKIRRLTARAMTRAWLTAPQVTHHEIADITELEELRRAYRTRVENAGGKLTITAILVKVAASALKLFPTLNASIDPGSEEIILKSYVNIGVAVDTEHGLLVPVIRNADRKNITEIAVELGDLAARARGRKLKPDEMQGGTFSISNLGGIGGTGFSPIVNWPEVAILGVSSSRVQPEWDDEIEDFEPRLMMPLSLSYDHRLVDGADAARFLRWLTEALESPLLLALEG